MNNSFKIANSIGMIDDDLIKEAGEIIERKAAPKKAVYLRYTAAAAAFICVAGVAGGAAVIAKTRSTQDPAVSIGPQVIDPNDHSTIRHIPDKTEMPVIKMSEVYFYEDTSLGEDVGMARRYYDPELYDTVNWNKQDLTEYYGKELAPKYIPEGLSSSRGNDTATVIIGKDGTVALDDAWLSYYHDFHEDGSPKLTEDVAAVKGFTVNASKLGMPFQCGIIVMPGDMKATMINGTEVFFGHRSMQYGPYDPETHEPSGYYDIYVAEFEFDGISYRITTDQLEATEIVMIVSSIICDSNFAVAK